MIYLITFIIIGLALMAMAVGVFMRRPAIQGSCGGIAQMGLSGSCGGHCSASKRVTCQTKKKQHT